MKFLDKYMDQNKRKLIFNHSSEEKTKKLRSKLFYVIDINLYCDYNR